jgi:citrate lyase subunit beta/citryl-CoA lyase
MIAKAATLPVDQVLLDLEDAVAVDAKIDARATVIEALNQQRWTAHTVSLRINDVETQWCHDDIIDVVTQAGEHLDTIILTKAKSIGDVRFVHLLLDQLERKLGLGKRIGIECLIEEVDGLMRAEEIAACSDRIETLIFGVGRLCRQPANAVGFSGQHRGLCWRPLALPAFQDDHCVSSQWYRSH